MDFNRIQTNIQNIEFEFNSQNYNPTDLGQKIERVRGEIEKGLQSIPAIKNAAERERQFSRANQLNERLRGLTQRIASAQTLRSGRDFSEAEPLISDSIRAVQASKGLTLDIIGASANPVGIVSKEHFIALEELKKYLPANLQIQKVPSPFDDEQVAQLIAQITDMQMAITLEQVAKKASKPLEKESFKKFLGQQKADAKLIKLIDTLEFPKTREEKAKLYQGLFKPEIPSSVEENFVRYDLNEIKEELISQLEQQAREYNLQNPANALDIDEVAGTLVMMLKGSDFVSRQEVKLLVQHLNEGLKTTYQHFNLNSPMNLKPYINTVRLHRVFANNPEVVMAMAKIPGFKDYKPAAVAKGGLEAFREPMMIRLAENFNLDDATLKKEVVVDAGLSAKGMPLQVVSPYIPDIKGSQLEKVWMAVIKDNSVHILDKAHYQQSLDQLRTIVSPEAYGESLALSLLLHASDDHFNQFALIDNHLVNYDLGRNLPPARAVYINEKGEERLCILLRSVLIDFPQFEDFLPSQVIEKLRAITPEKIEENLKEARVSEFRDPFKMREILLNMQKNPPQSAQDKQQLADRVLIAGNLQAANRIKYNSPQTIKEFLQKAEKGCEYPHNLAIHNLEEYRTKVSEEDKGRISDQIAKIVKASVDEREIERMKEGQRKVLAKIEAQNGALTGRELAETLYPDEITILDAYKELDYFLPGMTCGGISNNDAFFLLQNLYLFPPARRDKIVKAHHTLYAQACDMGAYKRYCVGETI